MDVGVIEGLFVNGGRGLWQQKILGLCSAPWKVPKNAIPWARSSVNLPSMRKFTFVWESAQPVPVEVLFAFHENPANLRQVQPPGLQVEKLVAASRAKVGEEFFLTVRQFGLRLAWVGRWSEVDAPNLLVDQAPKSPLPFFSHRHIFLSGSPIDSSPSRLRDELTLALPGSIARLPFAEFFVRLGLSGIFFYRHWATRRYLRKLVAGIRWQSGDERATQDLVELARGCSAGGKRASR
jgi:ligand-binding SRPBCC domain-containing protein